MRMNRVAKCCIITVLMMIWLSGCGLFRQKIDLENYIVWECQGINGYASLELALKVDQIQADLEEKMKKDEKKVALNTLLSAMEINGNHEENLSNGDVVVIHVDYDEELCKEAGVRIVGNDMNITVEGLEEGQLIDLFKDVEVQVTGVAPFATAQVVNHSEDPYMKNLTYTVEPSERFEYGSQLQIHCNADKAAAREFGYVYLHDTKGVSTTEVDYYVRSENDLNKELLSLLATEDYATINAESESSVVRMLYKLTDSSNYLFQYNKEWVDRMELKEIRLKVSRDFSSSKEQNQPVNQIYFIWEGYVTNADHGSNAYFCFAYNNLIKQGDGTYSVRHDQPELRYICSDSYEKIIEQISKDNAEQYTELMIPVAEVEYTNASNAVEAPENDENATKEH